MEDGIIRKSDNPDDGPNVYVIEYPDGRIEKIVKVGLAEESSQGGYREVNSG